MADYYPLLAKAVAGLPNSTPEARRAIYERARKALFGQLRSLEPPVPEAVIEREARALEEAVARLEVELSFEAPEADEAPATDFVQDAPAPATFDPSAGSKASSPAAEVAEPEPETPAPPADTTTSDAAPTEPPATERPAAAPSATVPVRDPASDTASSAGAETAAQAGPARKEVRRPTVPLPKREQSGSKRLWIVGAAVGVVVALVAVLAYVLRDRPEDVVRPSAATQPAAKEETEGGKIVDRIGGGETVPEEQAAVAPEPKPEEPPRPSLPQPEPPAAVARRAALLVEAPEESAKVKVRLGTVVWRVENVNNGPGEPLGSAVRAEVDIPEEKLQAVLTLQKNNDSALSATHTMKLRFVIEPGGALGNVNLVNVPYMRREDAPTGDLLNGVMTQTMENAFLVGLSKGPAEAKNIELLRNREWIDVPMVFANGRIGKLTFEKGSSGQRAIEDALAAWAAQQ